MKHFFSLSAFVLGLAFSASAQIDTTHKLFLFKAKLLQKIEELTLYVIAQDKELKSLKKLVKNLKPSRK